MGPKIIEIRQIEDLDLLLNIQGFCQVEMYLSNITVLISELNGNLYVRASDCEFPNLKHVDGNLSIDAEYVFFPKLETVMGDCNIHENNCVLSEIRHIGGNLKVLTDFTFLKLRKVGGKILKEGNISFSTIPGQNNTIVIKDQKEADLFPEYGIANLEIVSDNITIKNKEIRGNIVIKANNVSFPYLVNLKGKLTVGTRDTYTKEDLFKNINFPMLQNISSNCSVNVQDINLENLVKIGGKLTICIGKIDFKTLTFVRHLHLSVQNECSFKKLAIIGGDFTDNTYLTSEPPFFPELEEIKGNCSPKKLNAPKLTKIGGHVNFTKYDKVDIPNLEYIGGTAHFTTNVRLEKLKYINTPIFDSPSIHLPALKFVEHQLYKEEDTGNKKYTVKNYHFRVNEMLFLSSRSCSLSRSDIAPALHSQISIKQLISILKMKYSTFGSFKDREFKIGWRVYQLKEYQSVIKKIEKEWDGIIPIELADIFNIQNRNIRLFCFKYVPVATLMQKLEGNALRTKSIELDYFKYDENGNKISFKKNNTYEVYVAERDKIRDLWTAGDQKIYAVKCWCNSTNKEHWLWIEPQYAYNPLTAIASTFRIHENIIPHIKALKRQGDILICEMKTNIIPKGNIRPLTQNEYFGLLEVES
ncbi:hypothetical protein ACUN24_10500 [Pedobacter sp. WC2501]|uniref:hypothetical protein n=1 Tax=Pedobacter sp. WC2501 TaxID=3461400 RepID=UPI004045B346